MMMKKQSVVLSLALFMSLFVSGCCSNYKTYANSMASDLEALEPTYTKYVMGDERLSDADRKARLSILKEMREKTEVAKKDTE